MRTSHALALAVLAACSVEGSSQSDGVTTPCRIDLDAQLTTLAVPGLSVALTHHGRVVCTATAGEANREAARPVTTDTLFAWASVSKTVTGTALMILADDGKLSLDDAIDTHLPFAVANPDCPGKHITFRQLLTHTSSIIDDPATYDASYGIGDPQVALGDFVRDYLAPTALAGPHYQGCPGARAEYSNIGYGLIGYLVSRISGQRFEDFTRDRIFAPLGMTEAAWHLADLDTSHIAMPYNTTDGGFDPIGHIGFPTFPDGLLRTSPLQLARFQMMFEQGGALDGVRILRDETVAAMRRVQYPKLDDTQGLTWFYDDFGTHLRVLGHDGDDPGTASRMFFDPATGAGALLVANGAWPGAWPEDQDRDEVEADALFAALLDEAATY